MHHLPVQRRGLDPDERELLELCAEGWSAGVIAALLGTDRAGLRSRLRELCAVLGIAPRSDGRPPMHAARLWMLAERLAA
jgi:DNA-binding NarL/FixJ family response regulator